MSTATQHTQLDENTRVRSERIEEFLQVGVQAQFNLDVRDKRSLRLSGTLVGWEPGQYILMHAEFAETQSRILNAKVEGLLRFIADGRICSMRVQPVEGTVSKADPMIRLHWPEEVDAVSIRRESRVTVSSEGNVTLSNDVTVPCEVINVSPSGCRLYIPLKVATGDPLTCSFELPNGRPVIDERCIVRHVRHQGEGTVAGCEFEGLSSESDRAVSFYIATTVEREGNPDASQPRVLVYDDAKGTVDVAVDVLRLHGLDIVTANSLVKAFTWLGISLPDILLISSGQTELDAIEVCRIVRNTTGCKDLPIFVYGSADPALADALREAGGDGLLPSLSEIDEVLRVLDVGNLA